MKIALVTNKNLHHKYWVVEMSKQFNVEAIIHPDKGNYFNRIRSKKLYRYGMVYFLMKLLSISYSKISKKSFSRQNAHLEKQFFNDYNQLYDDIDKNKIFNVQTVNNSDALKIIHEKNIDIICFLGGDLAGKEFINSPKISTFNFHSGISPIYNGNKTLFHALSDLRPNFCGGTLMKMNERIDGGEILSHYLVPIDETDTPSTLYMKNFQGCLKLYTEYLNFGNFAEEGIPQKKSFKYYRNIDWTIANDIKLSYLRKKEIIKRFSRKEKIIKYYNDSSDKNLLELYDSILK